VPKKIKKIYKACKASKTYASKTPEEREKICRTVAVKASKQKWVQHKKCQEPILEEEGIIEYLMLLDEIELSSTGRMRIGGISITEEFMPKEDLKKYYKAKVGKKILFNHFHPVKDKVEIDGKTKTFPVFGEIIKSDLEELEDGKIGNRITADIYGFSPAHKHLQDMIREYQEKKEPLGFSDHFFTYKNKEGVVLHRHPEEVSITPVPVCGRCRIDNIEKLSKGDKMPEDKKEELTTEEKTTESTELSKEGEGPLKPSIIKTEVEETKASKEKEVEIVPELLQEDIAKLNSVIESQKSKISELEKLVVDKDSKIVSTETELSKAKQEIVFLTEKQPLLTKLANILGGKYKSNPKLQEHYKAFTPEQLEFETKRLSEEKTQTKEIPTDNEVKPTEVKSDEEKITETNPELERLIKLARLERGEPLSNLK